MQENTNKLPEEVELKKEHAWLEAQERARPMYEMGAKDFFTSRLASIKHAFDPIDRVIACIDEGVDKRGYRVAGSGILMPEEDFISYVQKNRITGLYTHDHCGAAALAANANGWTGDPDEFGKNWAKNMAVMAGIEYIGHIKALELKRPIEFHDAVLAYYIGTNRFSAAGIQQLVPGFHAHRKFGAHALDDLRLAVKIAMNSFGTDRFSRSPFRITILGNPNDVEKNFSALREEVQPILDEYPGLVLADGLDIPNEWIAQAA